jgi:predicted signal transduction protein with EAL and GGDEF domain
MGIALVRSGTPPEELMRRADLAMYESKSKGKGTCSVYQEAGVAEPENPPTVLFEVVSTTTEDELHQGMIDLGIREDAR